MTVASITDKECIKCSRDVKICADAKIGDIEGQKYDAVILPGGVGWKNLAAVSIFSIFNWIFYCLSFYFVNISIFPFIVC